MSRNLIICLVLIYVGWRIYRRVRRNIGRQSFVPRHLKGYIAFFALGSAVVAVMTLGRLPLLAGWLSGVVLGIALGILGLRLTRFEETPAGRFFTPNGHIGIALTIVFVGRLAYRSIVIYTQISRYRIPPPGQSALTDVIFELLAAYYIVYYAGVLKRFSAHPQNP